MKINIIIILLLFITNVSLSQIINIEKMRLDNDTSKLITYFSTNFSKKITKYDETSFNGCFNFYYRYKNNTFLNIMSSNIYSFNNEIDQYGFFEHFRYNYNVNNYLTSEIYLQYKYDNLLEINNSYIGGTGLRFILTNNDKYNIYYGISIMYHYKSMLNGMLSETLRNSNYITFDLKFTKNIRLISTLYYQPNIIDIYDYRLSNDNSFFFNINKLLELSIYYNFYKTSHPYPGINSFIYSTGLKIIIKYSK